MDSIDFLSFIKRKVKEREDQIAETLMSGALKDMEHYKYLQGELSSLYYVLTELKEFYKDK